MEEMILGPLIRAIGVLVWWLLYGGRRSFAQMWKDEARSFRYEVTGFMLILATPVVIIIALNA